MRIRNVRTPYDRLAPKASYLHHGGLILSFPPMGGGAEGSYDTRDLLTADQVPIRDLFTQIDDMLRAVTETRTRVESLFVEEVADRYVRTWTRSGLKFERGAEYGRPQAQRVSRASTVQGLPIESYKLLTMWTREYLALQTSEWLRREAVAVVEADQELQWREPLQTLFDNLAGTTVSFTDPELNVALTVRAPLYNGDGIVPPTFENKTFLSTHDHYFVSGTTAINAANVETLRVALDEHGHRGERFIFMNELDKPDFEALTDFLPVGDPLVILGANETRARLPEGFPTEFQVFGIVKNTGFRLVQWNMIPENYVVAIDTAGPKPVARREWPAGNQLRGLQLIRPAESSTYPVGSVYYERWVGWGGNYDRSNGAIMQIKASGTYDVPNISNSGFFREG